MSELKEVENKLRELRAEKKQLAAEKRANAEIRNEWVSQRAGARASMIQLRKDIRGLLSDMVEGLKGDDPIDFADEIEAKVEELQVVQNLFNEAREELTNL